MIINANHVNINLIIKRKLYKIYNAEIWNITAHNIIIFMFARPFTVQLTNIKNPSAKYNNAASRYWAYFKWV